MVTTLPAGVEDDSPLSRYLAEQAAAGAPSPDEQIYRFELDQALRRERARREARRLADAEQADQPVTPEMVLRLRGEMLTASQAAQMPPPVPLVAGLLYLDSIATMFGRPGSLKSFAALDVACHVATGMPWCARGTRRGKVLYLVAEGTAGFGKRIEGWRQKYSIDPELLTVLPRPVQANSPEWATLVEVAKQDQYSLIVIDTRARVTVGMDENSAEDMGVFVQCADQLKRAAGGCVLIVHHSGIDGARERGSTAVLAAMDTQLSVDKKRLPLQAEVKVLKQKDDADDVKVVLDAEVHDLGRVDAQGKAVTTLTLTPALETLGVLGGSTDDSERPAVETPWGKARRAEENACLRDIIAVMYDVAPADKDVDGVTLAQVKQLLGRNDKERSKLASQAWGGTTVLKWFNAAKDYGWLISDGGRSKWRVLSQEERRAATEDYDRRVADSEAMSE